MPFRVWWLLAVCLIAMAGWAVATVVYINRVATESERKWCGLVTTLDDTYRSTPPTTPLGRDIAKEMARLRKQFHCD